MFIINLLQRANGNIYAIVLATAPIIGLLIGITIHEFAHAWMANRLGDPTAKNMGRLTLNPFKHLDPTGTIFLLVAGFGWGKPVPYNPSNLKSDADELKVAFSGVVTNLFFALILGIPLRIATLQGVTFDSSFVLMYIKWIVEMNIVLVAFNILPIPPLDGSKLIFQSLDIRRRLEYEKIGIVILFALIISGFFGFPILQYYMEIVVRYLGFIVTGIYTSIF